MHLNETCEECGATTPRGIITHAYVPSSAGCWEALGALQADEMMRFGYPLAHRMVVDAYMAQHVGTSMDRRQVQSVFVHLMGLCLTLEHNLAPAAVIGAMRRVLPAKNRREFPKLFRTPVPGELTVLSMVNAPTLEVYSGRARAWASSVWQTWSSHHTTIRHAVNGELTQRV